MGYGHRIWPVTGGAKGFLIFYMFFATVIVGGIINAVSTIYLEQVAEEKITDTILDSTIW